MILRGGEFFGRNLQSRAIDGFDLGERVPTVPEHEIHRHMHAEAHFVLFLEGLYVSSARGAPEVAAAPMLDRKSTRLNSSHNPASRMPSSA
jgi:AraC family transcriptional regulator